MALTFSLKEKQVAVMEFKLENPLTSLKEHRPDTVPSLFANESAQMPPSHYYISVRRNAISLILKAQFSCDFDPFIPYLAISYLDRFISKQEIPKQRKPRIVKLLTVSCLSIAAKMKNTELSLSDLQRGEEGFIFDAQSIRRMELLILATLDWQMWSITPFSFLYFFLSLFHLRYPPLIESLKDRASKFIYKSHYEMKVLEYKPSIIGASALLCASQELLPLEFPCFRAAIASCDYVNKEKLLKCLTVMAFDAEASLRDTKTPIPNTTLITEERDNNNIKRRKLHGFCSDPVAYISPTQPC